MGQGPRGRTPTQLGALTPGLCGARTGSGADGIRRYVHLATGNYNGKTARIYTDVGILTANTLIGVDASAFFNLLSGYSDPPQWNKLAVAPLNLRETIYQEIDQMEKTKIDVREYNKKNEEFYIFAIVALLLLVAEVLLRNTVLKRIP